LNVHVSGAGLVLLSTVILIVLLPAVLAAVM